MFCSQLYTDSLKVINDDIHKHCALLGYRIGRLLGRDFYSIAYECYWIDETLDERSLVIKVIDFTHENQSMFISPPNETTDTKRRFKKISVKVGKKKCITIETTISRRFVPDFTVFRKEINELNYLNHQNLVIIRNILLFDKHTETGELSHVLMFIEFNVNNLKEKLRQIHKKRDYVTEEQSIHWSTQIVRGLAYLHSRAISHSNLKPSNILVFENKKMRGGLLLKLSDYGLAMLFPIKKKQDHKLEENDLYRDPKIDETFSKLKRKRAILCYSATRADIWSLAVIITEFRLEFNNLFRVFKDNSTAAAAKNLGNVYVERVKIVGSSTNLVDLLSKVLIYEPHRRMNIIEISQHEWIRDALKEQRQVTQIINYDSNGKNGTNDQKIDENVEKDSKTNSTVEEAFGIQDHKFLTQEDDDAIE